jgi:hypothetical protein
VKGGGGGFTIKRHVDENGVRADLFHDGSGQPRKAIVLMGGSEGGVDLSFRPFAGGHGN